MENKKKTPFYDRMRPYAKGFQPPFLFAVIGAIVSATVTVTGPNKLKEITNTIIKGSTPTATGMIPGIDLDKVGETALALAILYVISTVAGYIQSFAVTTIVQCFSQRLCKAVQTKIGEVPLSYFDSRSQGSTLSRVMNDANLLGQLLDQSLETLMTSTMLLTDSILMMFHSNVSTALTAIGSALAGSVLVMVIMGSP